MNKFKSIGRKAGLDRRQLLQGSAATAGLLSLPAGAWAQDAGDIPVGILMPFTGAGGPFGQEMLSAAKVAVEEINAAGGPLGRKIRIIEENDETNAEAGVRGARKLVDVDKVIAISATWASSVTLAVAPITQSQDIVLFSTSGSSRITDVQKDGFLFRTEPDDILYGKSYAEYILKQGWNKCAILGLNVPLTETTVGSLRERYEENGGEVTSFTIYNEDQTSFRSEILRAFADEPDVIHISGYEPDVTAILKAAYQAGLEGRFIVPGFSVSPALLSDAGPAAEGLILVEEGVAEGSAAYERLKTKLETDRYLSFGAQAYDHFHLLALAIEAGKSIEGKSINDMLKEVSGPDGEMVTSFEEGAKILREGGKIDYEGASGPINFDENGNIVRANFRISQVKDGEIVPIDFLEGVVF